MIKSGEMMPRWYKVECDACGQMHEATRSEERERPPNGELICGDCEMYARGYEDDESSNRVLAETLDKCIKLMEDGKVEDALEVLRASRRELSEGFVTNNTFKGWDDTVHLGPFTCVRACRKCGTLVSGGPTICTFCASGVTTRERSTSTLLNFLVHVLLKHSDENDEDKAAIEERFEAFHEAHGSVEEV